MTRKSTRRAFLATGATVAVTATAGSLIWQQQAEGSHPPVTLDAAGAARMPQRTLGRTGIQIPIFGLGGAGQTPLSKEDKEREAIALVEAALRLGVRYFDTAANYGASEAQLGKVLPPYRKEIFLSSKTDQRTRDGAWRELERSLKRLNTDHLDLWQMHHVSTKEDIDTIFGKNGAVQAIEEAKRQKLIRLAGITGHHEPAIILEGLRRYSFDSTLIPVNAADKHHPRPFIPTVLPFAREKGIGVVAMKVPAYGKLLRPGVLDNINQAIGYTLSQPGVTACVIAAESPAMLEENFRAAQGFQSLAAPQLAAIEKRTANVWNDMTFYRQWM